LNAKIKPLSCHENILVFSDGKHLYNRQFTPKARHAQRPNKHKTAKRRNKRHAGGKKTEAYGDFSYSFNEENNDMLSNPISILTISNHDARKDNCHPTQKTIELFEYLVKTYTNELHVALDPFLGSGTTLVACEQLGRLNRGVELHPPYVAVALERLAGMGLQPRRL
jgi:site-specific DNA-methyltransferase (adenine-specific)